MSEKPKKKCDYCGKNFVYIDRHKCKVKLKLERKERETERMRKKLLCPKDIKRLPELKSGHIIPWNSAKRLIQNSGGCMISGSAKKFLGSYLEQIGEYLSEKAIAIMRTQKRVTLYSTDIKTAIKLADHISLDPENLY